MTSKSRTSDTLALNRLTVASCQQLLPPRPTSSQKGDFGHVLVIGGYSGFAGAARMAAEAAARVGAGLTTVATLPEHVSIILNNRPELMATGVTSAQELKPLLAKASVLVLGPGLGQSPWSEEMFAAALNTSLPIVLDADGLNLLAASSSKIRRHNWILTPHPGEAARLLKKTPDQIQENRESAVLQLVEQYEGVCVLKGAGTLIASDSSLAINTTGNPGMASGGMGDILSGVIGGLLAQGLTLKQAAEIAVCLHGAAADMAVEKCGQRGLLATDLLPYLRLLVNGLTTS